MVQNVFEKYHECKTIVYYFKWIEVYCKDVHGRDGLDAWKATAPFDWDVHSGLCSSNGL